MTMSKTNMKILLIVVAVNAVLTSAQPLLRGVNDAVTASNTSSANASKTTLTVVNQEENAHEEHFGRIFDTKLNKIEDEEGSGNEEANDKEQRELGHFYDDYWHLSMDSHSRSNGKGKGGKGGKGSKGYYSGSKSSKSSKSYSHSDDYGKGKGKGGNYWDDDLYGDDCDRKHSKPTCKPSRRPTREPNPKPTRKPNPKPTIKPNPKPTRKPTPSPHHEPSSSSDYYGYKQTHQYYGKGDGKGKGKGSKGYYDDWSGKGSGKGNRGGKGSKGYYDDWSGKGGGKGNKGSKGYYDDWSGKGTRGGKGSKGYYDGWSGKGGKGSEGYSDEPEPKSRLHSHE